MSLHLFRLVAGLFLCGASLAASTVVPRTFLLPGHGTLTLDVPAEWSADISQPANKMPPTIVLKPRQGARFEVLMTTVWPLSASSGLTDDATLRREVSSAAHNAEAEAIEHPLEVQAIKGQHGAGYFFFATDKAPKPGESKFMTQGMIRTGQIALAFTILTNDGQESIRQTALQVLRTAQQILPAPAR